VKIEYYPFVSDEILEEAITIIKNNRERWDPPFFIDTKSYIDIENIKTISNQFINEKIKNIIVLGTGGSIQTLLALSCLAKKKIYPITSSRAVELKECLDKTRPEDSVVIPISRGGETLDVNSTIGIFLKKGYKFLGLSSMGTMNTLLKEINCPILDVPDLSGRYAGSISNVGIVPAYLAGIDIESFLRGLHEGYESLMKLERNPTLELSTFLYKLYFKGYKMVFSMPYNKNLVGSVELMVQGISESTGKDGRGLIGAYQAAPLCQHSVLEYLLGGTKGAVIPILWTLEKEISDIILKSSVDYINNQTAHTIINYQADATFQALIEQGVPAVKMTVESLDERNIGHLVAFILSTVYYLCLLLDVNWVNNPKVVIGKRICNEALKNQTPSEELRSVRSKIANEKFTGFWN